MRERCPDSIYIGIGRLPRWYVSGFLSNINVALIKCDHSIRKWFINSRTYANVKCSNADTVYGFVYLLSESDERRLDQYEGVPQSYVKKTLNIEFIGCTERTSVAALVYVDERRQGEGIPREEYIERMNRGIADAFKIPQEYVNKYLRPYIPE